MKSAADIDLQRQSFQFAIDLLLVGDQSLAEAEKVAQFGHERGWSLPEELLDLGLNSLAQQARHRARPDPASKQLELPEEKGSSPDPGSDHVRSDSETRCKRLALKALQMHLRNQGSADPACFSNPVCVASISLIPPSTKEPAQLASFVDVDCVAEASQASGQVHAGSGFDPHPGRAAAFEKDDLAMDALHISGASCLVQDLTKVIDDADACRFHTNVEPGPEFSPHACRPSFQMKAPLHNG